jgi:hypothetical protein
MGFNLNHRRGLVSLVLNKYKEELMTLTLKRDAKSEKRQMAAIVSIVLDGLEPAANPEYVKLLPKQTLHDLREACRHVVHAVDKLDTDGGDHANH